MLFYGYPRGSFIILSSTFIKSYSESALPLVALGAAFGYLFAGSHELLGVFVAENAWSTTNVLGLGVAPNLWEHGSR